MKYKLNVIVVNWKTFDKIENVISIPKLGKFFQLQKYQHFQHIQNITELHCLQRKRIKELLRGSTFDTFSESGP